MMIVVNNHKQAPGIPLVHCYMVTWKTELYVNRYLEKGQLVGVHVDCDFQIQTV